MSSPPVRTPPPPPPPPPPSPPPSPPRSSSQKSTNDKRITELHYTDFIDFLANKGIPDSFKTSILGKIKEKDTFERLIKVVTDSGAYDYEKKLNILISGVEDVVQVKDINELFLKYTIDNQLEVNSLLKTLNVGDFGNYSKIQALLKEGEEFGFHKLTGAPVIMINGSLIPLHEYFEKNGRIEDLQSAIPLPGVVPKLGELASEKQKKETKDRIKKTLKGDQREIDKFIEDTIEKLDKFITLITLNRKDSFELNLFKMDKYIFQLSKLERIFKEVGRKPKESDTKMKGETIKQSSDELKEKETPQEIVTSKSRLQREQVRNSSVYNNIINTKYKLLYDYVGTAYKTMAFPQYGGVGGFQQFGILQNNTHIPNLGGPGHLIRQLLVSPRIEEELKFPQYESVSGSLLDENIVIQVLSNLTPQDRLTSFGNLRKIRNMLNMRYSNVELNRLIDNHMTAIIDIYQKNPGNPLINGLVLEQMGAPPKLAYDRQGQPVGLTFDPNAGTTFT